MYVFVSVDFSVLFSIGKSKYRSKFNDARCTTCKYATKCTSTTK